MDSFIGRMLGNIAAMSRVLDAETVVVGMQPAVAITLVELGSRLTGVRTALNVDAGMELLRASVNGAKDGVWQSSRLRTLPVQSEPDVVAVRRRVREVIARAGVQPGGSDQSSYGCQRTGAEHHDLRRRAAPMQMEDAERSSHMDCG